MNTKQKLNELNGLNALSQGEEASNSEIQIPTPMNREQDKSQAPNPNADRERDRAEGEATAVSASPEDLPGKHRAWHIEQRACGLEPVNGGELVNRPVVAANISSPAFFRVIEETRPTLLIDEADTFLRGSDELRGILNA